MSAHQTPAPIVVCRYANRPGRAAACGAFDSEHHAAAAAAGLCCVDAAFRLDLGTNAPDPGQPQPVIDDWPPFEPSDADVPGGAW